MVNKNDPIFREAIWGVYQKFCFYNKELIHNIYDLHIDHMLPESLTQEKLQKIIESYNLRPDYDLNAIYNLVPACSKCNSVKTNYIPDKTTLLNNLTITRNKEPKIKEKMDQIRKDLKKFTFYLRLAGITKNEVDDRKIDILEAEILEQLQNIRIRTKENLIKRKASAVTEGFEKYEEYINTFGENDLLLEMNDPVNSSIYGAREYLNRILKAKNNETKKNLLMMLKYPFFKKPRGIYRIYSIFILLKLLEEGIQSITGFGDIKNELERICINNINYWSDNARLNALCHLDNISIRLGKRVALSLFYNYIKNQVTQINEEMTEEEKKVNPVRFSEIVVFYYGRIADLFWEDLNHYKTVEDIWDGIWLCQEAEKQIKKIPINEKVKDLDEMTMFESYGGTFDMYCYGTWEMLRRFPSILSTLQDDLKKFTKIERDKLRFQIPPLRKPPDDWEIPIKKNLETNIVGLLLALKIIENSKS